MKKNPIGYHADNAEKMFIPAGIFSNGHFWRISEVGEIKVSAGIHGKFGKSIIDESYKEIWEYLGKHGKKSIKISDSLKENFKE